MNAMDEKALDLLIKTGQKAAGVENASKLMHVKDSLGRTATVLINHRTDSSGAHIDVLDTKTFVEDAPRIRKVNSIDQIATAIEAMNGYLASPVIWHNTTGVSVEFGDTYDRIHCALNPTEEAEELRNQPRAMSTSEMRKWLLKLAHCWGTNCITLYNALANLRFANGVVTRLTSGHGRESLGREAESSVASLGDAIPESVVLEIPVVDDRALAGFKKRITCQVVIEPANSSVSLEPCCDDVRDMNHEIAVNVAKVLRETAAESTPIVYGEVCSG